MTQPLHDTALLLTRHGCSVVPARTDGTKAPAGAWQRWQRERADDTQLADWFGGDIYDGLGVVCGAISGGLEMLELEGRAVDAGLITRLADLYAAHGLDAAWKTLLHGYCELTPAGGLHLLYRVAGTPRRNLRLASRPGDHGPEVLIETRGEGGYVVVAPSAGRTHPSGRPWTLVAGGPATIPTISVDERDALHAVAAMLDELPHADPAPAATAPGGSGRPGDDFEARTTWEEILVPHGWQSAGRIGAGRAWRRPGKQVGTSATTGMRDVDRLYVFSTSTVFEPSRPYTKFGAYAVLEHGGDHGAAARELARRGYGDATTRDAAVRLAGSAPRPARHLSVVEGSAALDLSRDARPDPSEDWTALEFVAAHRHDVRYVPERARWLVWTGRRWAWDTAGLVREHVRAVARTTPDSDGWRAHRRRVLSAAGVAGVLALAATDPAVVAPLPSLDADPWALNTPGGVVDLRTGVLRPPDPAGVLHTRSTTATPSDSYTGSRFERFLADTFPDPALRRYVRLLAGISALGVVREQILPFAFGVGANGKSTLLEALMHAFGVGDQGYAIAAAAEMLMIRRHTEHPAELAQLAGARLVVCSELDEGQRFAEARVKLLTGRDSINARFMRGNPFTFTPSHTLWLVGNHRPAARTGGMAFWRRVKLIPFSHIVPADKRDSALPDALAEEAGIVLGWVVAGAVEYLSGGLDTPPAVESATREYEESEDTIKRFADDRLRLATNARVPIREVRSAYESWCREAGEEPVSTRRFGPELRERYGVEEKQSHGLRYYVGIGLVAVDSPGTATGTTTAQDDDEHLGDPWR